MIFKLFFKFTHIKQRKRGGADTNIYFSFFFFSRQAYIMGGAQSSEQGQYGFHVLKVNHQTIQWHD